MLLSCLLFDHNLIVSYFLLGYMLMGGRGVIRTTTEPPIAITFPYKVIAFHIKLLHYLSTTMFLTYTLSN